MPDDAGKTDTADLTVTAGALASIVISPSTASIAAGATFDVSAISSYSLSSSTTLSASGTGTLIGT